MNVSQKEWVELLRVLEELHCDDYIHNEFDGKRL